MNQGWWTGSGLRATLDQTVTTKVKHLVGTGLMALLVVLAGALALRINFASDRKADATDAAEVGYFSDLRIFDTQTVQRKQCLDRVDTRIEVRNIMIGFNQIDVAQNATLRGILVMIDEADDNPTTPIVLAALALVDAQDTQITTQRQAIDTDYALLDPADCPEEPTLPVVPDSLEGHDLSALTLRAPFPNQEESHP